MDEMLPETIHLGVSITAFLLGVIVTIYLILRIAPLIGRPLVRRLFGLAYSDDKAALTQTGEIATIILGFLILGIWVLDCARETTTSGLLLTEWSVGMVVRVMAESILAAILVEGMLSGLSLVLPGSHNDQDAEGRRTMVKSMF